MTDDIEEKLRLLTTAREKLQADLAETATVLDAVEDKIQDFKRRQQARMFEDVRLDNELFRQQQSTKFSSLSTQRPMPVPLPEEQAADIQPPTQQDTGTEG